MKINIKDKVNNTVKMLKKYIHDESEATVEIILYLIDKHLR